MRTPKEELLYTLEEFKKGNFFGIEGRLGHKTPLDYGLCALLSKLRYKVRLCQIDYYEDSMDCVLDEVLDTLYEEGVIDCTAYPVSSGRYKNGGILSFELVQNATTTHRSMTNHELELRKEEYREARLVLLDLIISRLEREV